MMPANNDAIPKMKRRSKMKRNLLLISTVFMAATLLLATTVEGKWQITM